MTDPTLFDTASDPPPGPMLLAAPTGWPDPPGPDAYHGLPGEIVKTLAPHTEADPAAILSQLLGVAPSSARNPTISVCRH
jgi:hypothetical protein